MELSEVRAEIDRLDPEIRKLLLRRLDCSERAVRAKIASGGTEIFRPEREQEILKKLSGDVPEEKRAAYTAVLKRILVTSRMYQYGILLSEEHFDPRKLSGPDTVMKTAGNGGPHEVRAVFTPHQGGVNAALGMIADYGYQVKRLEAADEASYRYVVTFSGDISAPPVRQLLYQLSQECAPFRVVEVT